MNDEKICYNDHDLLEGEIYAWVMDAFISGHPSSPEFTNHLRCNPPCLQQIAEIWHLLSERDEDAKYRLPAPNLSFLSIRGSG